MELEPAAEPTDPAAVAGKAIFETQCARCHVVNGFNGPHDDEASKGADLVSNAAPNLTHLMSRKVIAGGMLPNTIDNLKAWVNDPQVVKPGCDMPALKLDPEQIEDVVAYLATLK